MFATVLLTTLFAYAASSTTTSGQTDWTPHPDCPFPAPGEIIYLPSPTDCAVFYECVDGIRYENKCTDGLWWNPLIDSCDYPGDFCDAYNSRTPTESTSTWSTTPRSTTPTSTTSSPTTTTTTTIPTTTTTTTILPTTTTTTTTTTIPPTTTTTTPTTTTTHTTTTTTVTPTPTTPISPQERCKNETLSYWPHPDTCSRFIECYEGNAYEMACPEGLYFSDYHKSCVNPRESECCATTSNFC